MKVYLVFLTLTFPGICNCGYEDLGCDPGWIAGNGRCYYVVNNKQVTKKNAKIDCGNKFASLIQINDADQMSFVKSFIVNYTASDGFWTDLTDTKLDGTHLSTGKWLWGKSQPLLNNTIKWQKYPTSSPADACGVITSTGYMKNIRCSHKLGYICKISKATWCPAGWTQTQQVCWMMSDLTDPTQLLDWKTAKQACATKTLPANITSRPTLLSFANSVEYFNAVGLMFSGTTTLLYWTGLQRSGPSWTWSNGDPFMSNSVQWAVEPDHIANNEDCGVMKPDGTFSDEDCTKSFNYICQRADNDDDTDFYFGCGGWWRAGHSCYSFYRAPRTSWQKARYYCQKVGADLLKVESLDEKHWVEQATSETETIGDYWVGLNDQAVEGTYRWADGSLYNVSFINWNQEPNHWFGTEHCVSMINSGVFNDEGCEIQNRFICEYADPFKKGNCPVSPGWHTDPRNGGCYLVSPSNDTRSWYEADRYCRSIALATYRQTTLIAFNSPEEVNWIINILSAEPFQRTAFWTDLNDRQSGGAWSYSDDFNNPPKMDLINWRGEPDDPSGIEDCVYMGWNGRYFDVRCNITLGFICERPARYSRIGSGQNSSLRSADSLTVNILLLILFSIVRRFVSS